MKKFTYNDIAKSAGISIATISRVFNNPEIVSASARNKVINAVTAMGEDPNAYGLLPDPADRLIIFNVPTLRNQFYSPIIESARKIALSKNYLLLINEDNLSPSSLDQFLLLLLSFAPVCTTENMIIKCSACNIQRFTQLIDTVWIVLLFVDPFQCD